MNLIAWSQNMPPEAAKAAGAILVSKDQLLERADILTIHLVLSSRTRGLVGVAELEGMKPTARLINASRGGHRLECSEVARHPISTHRINIVRLRANTSEATRSSWR